MAKVSNPVQGGADVGPGGSISGDTVQTLSKMIKDLEGQLDRMLELNEAMEKDLARERQRRAEMEDSLAALQEKLRRAEQEAANLEDLRAETRQLQEERARLQTSLQELGRQSAEAEKENRRLTGLTDRLRLERDDTIEELQSVEEQFGRAMELCNDLRAQLALLGEERDALKGRQKLSDDERQQMQEERDSLLAEVDESRKALEEIRRSLVEACVRTDR
jgi:chromosome segregation ATPase